MVSILLATTGRPDMAERCVRQLRATTAGHVLEIVCAIDNDPESRDRLEPLVHRTLYSPEYRGSARAWNDCLAVSQGDPIVLAADDLDWQPGWLGAALGRLAEFPDGWGLVGFNDGHWGPELSTHYLMSRRFIIEVLGGRVAWDWYPHSFADVETNERAQAAGRYAWCEQARVLHSHWLFGDREQDNTDRRQLSGHETAQRVFLQRRAEGFPNCLPPVIER